MRASFYEGPVLQTVRDVPHGASNPLDAKVYWLYPGGVLRCLSARELYEGGIAAVRAEAPETIADYESIAAAWVYMYLEGRCDVTEFLENRGVMREEKWKNLDWQLPESALSSCWWLTNPHDAGSTETSPQLLCKSLGILRASQHRLRVATLAKVRNELSRRRQPNATVREELQGN